MNRRKFSTALGLAVAGLAAGAAVNAADDKKVKKDKVAKHDCKGKNDCKGQGGCNMSAPEKK